MKYTYSPDDNDKEEPRREASASAETSLGINQNIVGLLTYVLGWATGIAFLFIEKENSFVRFHAMQSIAVFVPLTIASFILPFVPFIGGLLTSVVGVMEFLLWLFLMYQAFIGNRFRIPIAGDWDESQLKNMGTK